MLLHDGWCDSVLPDGGFSTCWRLGVLGYSCGLVVDRCNE